MNDRTKAALIGGIIAGVLSGIPFIGGCCFLWALGGGFLAIYMIMKNSNAPMEMGEGAKVGAIAGAIAIVAFLIIRIPLMLLGVGAAALNSQAENAGFGAGLAAVAGIGGMVIGAVVIIVCAVLGGVIGVAVLGKGRGVPPPPPPPAGGFGGSGM
ncbi:MAG TPA: hypothetical protein VLJ61_04675 [Pyrinomonadaceae bacterium]|nr:hypothetical protein [Pyrinomonadaceae bacterium]